jgi:hypothetical protein
MSMGYMKDFLFTPEQANTPIGKLSGGERARVALARALSLPSNFLVLDEPTNDLDLETLDLLEEMVSDYAGTVIVVSHDRDFLDRVATSVIIAEGNGDWTEYAGGYSDMVIQRGEGVQARAARCRRQARCGTEGRGGAARPVATEARADECEGTARAEDPAGADGGARQGDRGAGGKGRRWRFLRPRSGGLRQDDGGAGRRAGHAGSGGGTLAGA